MLQYNYIVQCNPLNWSVSAWPLFTFIQQSWKACSNHIYWLQSVNHWSNLSSHTGPPPITRWPSLVENSGMTCVIYRLCLQSKSKSRVAFLWKWFMSSLLYGMSHALHCSKSRHLITARHVFDNLFDQSVRGYWRNFWWRSAWRAEKMCRDV